MKETAIHYGADPARVEAPLKEVLEFETKLAEASLAKEKRRNRTALYNPIVLKDFPVLDGHPPSWVEYVDKILFEQYGIQEDEVIIVLDTEYMKVNVEIFILCQK